MLYLPLRDAKKQVLEVVVHQNHHYPLCFINCKLQNENSGKYIDWSQTAVGSYVCNSINTLIQQ